MLFIFRGRGREGKREGEKHQCVVASCLPPTGDLAHNPGMCPDWESNQRPFGLQAHAQSTKLYQPGLSKFYLKLNILIYYPLVESGTNLLLLIPSEMHLDRLFLEQE